jgi:hypothetical protein
MIIAVFSERNDRSYTASVGIFLNNLTEEPVFVFAVSEVREEELEKLVARKIEELATDDYRWKIYFFTEIKILRLENKTLFFFNPNPYLNMTEVLFNCFPDKEMDKK